MVEKRRCHGVRIERRDSEPRPTEAALCQRTRLPATKFVDARDDQFAVGAHSWIIGMKSEVGKIRHVLGLTIVLAHLLPVHAPGANSLKSPEIRPALSEGCASVRLSAAVTAS